MAFAVCLGPWMKNPVRAALTLSFLVGGGGGGGMSTGVGGSENIPSPLASRGASRHRRRVIVTGAAAGKRRTEIPWTAVNVPLLVLGNHNAAVHDTGGRAGESTSR